MVPGLASSAAVAGFLILRHTDYTERSALSRVDYRHKALPQLPLLVLQGHTDASTQIARREGRDTRRLVAGGPQMMLGDRRPSPHLLGCPHMELFCRAPKR